MPSLKSITVVIGILGRGGRDKFAISMYTPFYFLCFDS